jgi:hypothetical protein
MEGVDMDPVRSGLPGRGRHRALATLFATMLAAASIAAVPTVVSGAPHTTDVCQLNSAKSSIHHVIHIQFDNTHFQRDNPNVPSDLEQMPNLLNFIQGNGTLLTNDHTVLISHTATGILSTLTGVYPDRMGQPVSNSFRYFTSSGASRTGVSFAYWTAPLFDPVGPPFPPAAQTDLTPEMINENGKIAPAPWVPYTRAGCDVGSVATANTILENTGIDVATVFGAGSPEAIQAAADSPGVSSTQTFADFVGIGVHCAQGSALCATANHGRADRLPDEPADPSTGAAYTGFNGLFGAKYVDPQIGMAVPTDLDGNVIKDANGHVGFPGFDGMEATTSLSWVAAMQEHGVPVTYAYISDAHDGHGTAGNIHFAYGPGEAGYVQQLKDYDAAFGKFFTRLAADGINKSNTLFVFTVDEGDHFAGDAPTPAGCDGVTTPCTYNRVGEINANLGSMIRTQFGDTTPFAVHSDDAPNVYVNGNPGPTNPAVRALERESGHLTWLNPYTGAVQSDIIAAMADPVTEKTLHMVTADPNRTPTFTLFADPDWFFFSTASGTCATPVACASIPARTPQSFAWNHGDIQDEIASTWVGYVGPGVRNAGQVDTVWTDHTDVRPTMLSLLGLVDDNVLDGRVVTELMQPWAIPAALHAHGPTWQKLAATYKQLNASFGTFSMAALAVSTRALASGSAADDSTYTTLQAQIASWTSQRDALASRMKALLNDSAFHGTAITEQGAKDLIKQGNALIDAAVAAAD